MGVFEKILTELLITQLAVRHFLYLNKEMKFLLVVACLALVSPSLSGPVSRLQSYLGLNDTEEWLEPVYDVKDDILDGWEWLQEFLPNKVITYIEKSADDGQDLLKELYEETKKDVEEKTDKHVEEVSKIVEGFMDRLISIKDNTVEIAAQGVPLSEKEIEARNDQEGLEKIKDKLNKLRNQVEKERQDDKKYEGLEGMIQRLITSAREVLDEVNGQTDLMWSKVKQMEVEVYRVNDILADTTGDLKDVLKEVFSTLNKELREASPALKEILDKVEKEEGLSREHLSNRQLY